VLLPLFVRATAIFYYAWGDAYVGPEALSHAHAHTEHERVTFEPRVYACFALLLEAFGMDSIAGA
jgi:hypothetical protein